MQTAPPRPAPREMPETKPTPCACLDRIESYCDCFESDGSLLEYLLDRHPSDRASLLR